MSPCSVNHKILATMDKMENILLPGSGMELIWSVFVSKRWQHNWKVKFSKKFIPLKVGNEALLYLRSSAGMTFYLFDSLPFNLWSQPKLKTILCVVKILFWSDNSHDGCSDIAQLRWKSAGVCIGAGASLVGAASHTLILPRRSSNRFLPPQTIDY